MLSSKPTKADLDHKFDYEDSLKSSDSNMAFRLQHSSPVSKREYIQQWQGELPDEKPAEKPEGNQLCLYRELKDLKEQIRFLNTYTDRLLSSVCTTSIVRCLNRLCGLFSPTWEFYSVLNDLSKVTGTKRPQDWLHDTNLLDTAIAKCLRVTLNQYDDVNPIDINLDLNIDNNSERLERFTPPDVLKQYRIILEDYQETYAKIHHLIGTPE
ncbi:uncharacterized protein L201_004233 [Kwoniella dendrophila CBS 6074]|uniref:Uncharacterized protein n=1 Tax=Kwoniella dendrophila CBS 6074 TaxID=1295534 RepID=A0AAX4JVF1_9TREE